MLDVVLAQLLYGSDFVAADQTSFFAARVKQWHQSGRWMDDVSGLCLLEAWARNVQQAARRT